MAEHCLGKMLDAKKNRGQQLPYLRNPNIRWFHVDTSDLQTMPFEDHEHERYGLRAGDILICEGGEAGRAAIWDDRLSDVKFQKAIHRVRPGPRLDGRYLIHRLMADYYSGRLGDYYTGATIKHLTGQDLAKYEFPLPPLTEQRRMTALLDGAEALRSKRRAALAQLDALTQAIFRDMCGISPRPRWPRMLLPRAFWFQEGPGVRKWQFTEAGIKLLNVGNIEQDGTLDLSKTNRHLSEDEVCRKYTHFLVDAGDLVMASSGISFGEDGMLRTRGAFVTTAHLPLCMNTSTIRFKALAGVSDLRFLLEWLESPEFREQITKFVTGSAQQNFGPSHLSRVAVSLPPLDVQHAFARRAAAIDEMKATHRASLASLDALFASLQQRAFRGEL